MEPRMQALTKVPDGPVMELPMNASVKLVSVEWELAPVAGAAVVPPELRFRASSSTDQLTGSPRQFFNEPKPGEDLLATLPVPRVGSSEEARLEIRSSVSGGPIHVEARIRRPV